MLKLLSLTFLLAACSTTGVKKSPESWRDRSHKLVHDYAEELADFYPEYVSLSGFSQFERQTTPYSITFDQDLYAFSYQWKSRLERMLQKEGHEEMKTDIRILLERVTLDMEQIEMIRKEGVVPFLPIAEHVYLNLKDLIDEKASDENIQNALARFRSYVRGDEEQLPVVDGFISYSLKQLNYLKDNNLRGFWPLKEEVESYLRDADSYLVALGGLLAKTKSENWKEDFHEFKTQEAAFRDFIRKTILPHARKDMKASYGVYAFTLKEMGIKEGPEKLIDIARADYQDLYKKFIELGRIIAEDNKLPANDPVSVVNFLESKKISTREELLELYVKTNDELYAIVKDKNLITLREKPNLLIRFATDAEAKSLPAPHFINSAFFGKDKDRPGQFVITPPEGGRDDFSFPEAVITLSAHEAIPGHGLQYHMMKERGTTLMRSWLAFNSVNVEGWGLYAEDLVYPYLSKEAQFTTLQRRLWRVARMFLDPELNLGRISPQRVLDLYMKELGFSEPFARSELKRYSYLMPGQATAYYYGYKKLMSMKRPGTNLRCFNDGVLNFGILPLDEISARLEKLNCEAAP
jgi:Bacterial protein of unknown function (DUF885)